MSSEYIIATTPLTAESLKSYMASCGYDASLIRENFAFTSNGTERQVAWAAFSQNPPDARSANLAAVDLPAPTDVTAAAFRPLGAPTLFACHGNELYWFQHDVTGTRFLDRIARGNVVRFFDEHNSQFEPQRIYRAKTSAKFNPSDQLYFVDAGLMPVLEKSSGEWLGTKVELLVDTVHRAMPKAGSSQVLARWVFQSVFWLLAARLLHDKSVPSFKTVNVADPDDVFDRVARHYNADAPPISSKVERDAILAAAKLANGLPSLTNITTESLAYLHENTLVSDEMRDAFGTHSTPQWLVDYIMWQLTPWIDKMPLDSRHVFEPACGHSPFLVAAVRLLRQLAPSRWDDQSRLDYLRKHIHGVEKDDFAREIGRLSLTLADVPNRNGWDVKQGDVFVGNEVSRRVKNAGIVLSNPPFEDFKDKDRKYYKKQPGLGITYVNKAAELFARIIADLPKNSVFGMVMPQSILTSKNSRYLRNRLTREFELREICLLPDRVFGKSKAESVVLLGRRLDPSPLHTVTYQRVRPWDLDLFKTRLEASSESIVPQSSFLLSKEVSFRLPDLQEVWDALKTHARLETLVDVQKGFEFKNEKELGKRNVVSDEPRSGWVKAYLKADDNYPIWRTPIAKWVDYSKRNLRREGAKPGQPQVLVNYAGSQWPWCRKATIDGDGVPVSSRFLAFRPKDLKALPLRVLWAVMNSPIANAYAHSVSTKWQTLPKEWRSFRMPRLDADSIAEITTAAEAYRAAAESYANGFFSTMSKAQVRDLLMKMDAAVLRAYGLPPSLEQQLLAIFNDIDRPGVGCHFTSYPQVPTSVHLPFHVRLLLPRFHELVALCLAGKIKRQQQKELSDIEGLFDEYERETPNNPEFQAWMTKLDQRHDKIRSELDIIEAAIKKRRGGGGA